MRLTPFRPQTLALAIRAVSIPLMSGGYTYIVGSHTGTLYIGVTSDLYTRIQQHRNGTFEGFTATYDCKRLLYFERHEDIREAIAREKQLKGWRREKNSISFVPSIQNSKTLLKPGAGR
jgi:predicted GIY-YIG superfamily endonuclease